MEWCKNNAFQPGLGWNSQNTEGYSKWHELWDLTAWNYNKPDPKYVIYHEDWDEPVEAGPAPGPAPTAAPAAAPAAAPDLQTFDVDGEDNDEHTLAEGEVVGDAGMEQDALQATESGEAATGVAATLAEAFDTIFTESSTLATDLQALKLYPTKEKEKALPEGEQRKRGDEDFNPHFYSNAAAPFRHQDLFRKARSTLEYENPMTAQEVKEYQQKYGTTANLFLHGATVPRRIKGVKAEPGIPAKIEGKIILDMRICDLPDEEVTAAGSRRHSRWLLDVEKICAIYWEKSKMRQCSADEKRRGMRFGILTCKKKPTTQSPLQALFPNSPKVPKTQRIVLPAVFNPPPDYHPCFLWEKVRGFGTDGREPDCETEEYFTLLKKIKKTIKMTVFEWICSPWHYEFLPYRSHQDLFKDGETYSFGCNRCSRPFCEFPRRYMSYLHTPSWARSWPGLTWQGEDRGEAPKPFDCSEFWDENQLVRQKNVAGGGTVQPVLDKNKLHDFSGELIGGSSHNWPTRKFNGMVGPELQRRSEVKKPTVRAVAQLYKDNEASVEETKLATFREYNNWLYDELLKYHVHNKDKKEGEGCHCAGWPLQIQGRMQPRAKVKFAQRNYYLARSSKFGNICMDCAAILETAPGLYYRVRRGTVSNGVLAQIKPSDENQRPSNWWYDVAEKIPEILPYVLTGTQLQNTETTPGFKEAMEKVFKAQRDRHGYADLGLTKFSTPPEIHVEQAVWSKGTGTLEGKSKKYLRKILEDAEIEIPTNVSSHKELIDLAQSNGLDAQGLARVQYGKALEILKEGLDKGKLELKNEQLVSVMKGVMQQLQQRYAAQPAAQAKMFEADLFRREERNVDLKVGDKIYPNSLRTRVLQPQRGLYNAAGRIKKLDKTDFQEKIWPCKMVGENDAEQPDEQQSQWTGDRYVMERIGGKWVHTKQPWYQGQKRPLIQYRKLRQSRLFITWALHRPLTGEEESRLILERMRDAVALVFGNDVKLAEMLRFGQKLQTNVPGGDGNASIVNHQTDAISRHSWTNIPAPNKKDALPLFYGGGGGSSYLSDTYQTHVESVDLQAGIELGPNRHHPHFHALLTINHWSYVQLDTFIMNQMLEKLFKDDKGPYYLVDSMGLPFYGDQENPYVDLRLYPEDGFQDVLAAYVRKSATPGPLEALAMRYAPAPPRQAAAPAGQQQATVDSLSDDLEYSEAED